MLTITKWVSVEHIGQGMHVLIIKHIDPHGVNTTGAARVMAAIGERRLRLLIMKEHQIPCNV